ncbi:MAG: DUF5606 domain-containing protein [Cyclobacteriaceae bacterium]|nr:DUF5606 domain-containing protein [Cyclobacteriaceae bacterium]
MDFSELASVSGKSGLFKILNPTRAGVILETLDGTNKKLVVGMNAKVSVLSDISIYTNDGDGSVPLKDILQKIHVEFKGDTGLTKTSDGEELKSFLKFVLPNYDEDRVYASDIKKLVAWYHQLVDVAPEVLTSETNKDTDTAPEGEK